MGAGRLPVRGWASLLLLLPCLRLFTPTVYTFRIISLFVGLRPLYCKISMEITNLQHITVFNPTILLALIIEEVPQFLVITHAGKHSGKSGIIGLSKLLSSGIVCRSEGLNKQPGKMASQKPAAIVALELCVIRACYYAC